MLADSCSMEGTHLVGASQCWLLPQGVHVFVWFYHCWLTLNIKSKGRLQSRAGVSQHWLVPWICQPFGHLSMEGMHLVGASQCWQTPGPVSMKGLHHTGIVSQRLQTMGVCQPWHMPLQYEGINHC